MPVLSADWPAPLAPVMLQGKLIRLEPLRPDHEPELLKISADEQIWRYLTSNALPANLAASLRDHLTGSALPFVIRAKSDGRLLGMIRLKNLSREHRKAMVGSWVAPSAWGSGANTEAKLLLLEYAFESLHCRRIEFHTDKRNLRSRAALRKMGAVEEGTLRSYLVTRDGHRRDTVVFSVLDTEWPDVKRTLRLRLEAQISNK
ncbi:MAG TPA: GNAT family protein [Candidatus Limnocylindrales bacterium]|nr:GNAT family protein [Candidatus Limnocylindrales bacterium]